MKIHLTLTVVKGRCVRFPGILRTFSITPLLLAISACTTLGPDFETPQADVDAKWQTGDTARAPEESSAETIENWWSVFNDPILDRLIDEGYRQNLSLQVAGLRILEARAQLGIAIGQQYPQRQQASAGLSRTGLSENSPNFIRSFVDDRYNQANIGLDAAWELDFWGRFRRGVESADASLGASIADYDNALVSLTAEIATVYLNIRTFEERLRIARNNVETQKGSYHIAEVRYQNGAVSELDPAQANYLLMFTKSTVPDLEGRLRQARNAMSTLLGLTPGQLGSIMDTAGSIPEPPQTLNLGAPADLLRRRPDIRQAEMSAAAQSALVGVAETDLYPRLALLGSVGLLSSDTGNSSLGDLFKSDSITFNYGPSASWAIFNYGRIKNQVRVQDARLQALLVNYRNTVLRAAREVEDGIASFVGARDRTAYLKQARASAQHAVDLALIQYKEGAVDYQRVLDTQRALLDLEDQYTASRGEAVQALVATYKALGGGWKIRAGNDFVPEDVQRQMQQRTDSGRLMDDGTLTKALPAAPPTGGDQPLFNRPDW